MLDVKESQEKRKYHHVDFLHKLVFSKFMFGYQKSQVRDTYVGPSGWNRCSMWPQRYSYFDKQKSYLKLVSKGF